MSKKQNYERVGRVYHPKEVLKHITFDHQKHKVEFDGHIINIYSNRLKTFAKNLRCAKCGIKGRYFVKERAGNSNFHFNLYALTLDGEEILMTKDHIIPKSKGGSNSHKNLQTMCYSCNQEKADGK